MSAIRFRGYSDEELAAIVKSLVAQIGTGRATVAINGNAVSFSSPAQIETMIVAVEREIVAREDAAAGRTKRRSWVFRPNMPDGKGYL